MYYYTYVITLGCYCARETRSRKRRTKNITHRYCKLNGISFFKTPSLVSNLQYFLIVTHQQTGPKELFLPSIHRALEHKMSHSENKCYTRKLSLCKPDRLIEVGHGAA